MGTKTRFEEEAKRNSEMAYYQCTEIIHLSVARNMLYYIKS